jgi:hypothetical protein
MLCDIDYGCKQTDRQTDKPTQRSQPNLSDARRARRCDARAAGVRLRRVGGGRGAVAAARAARSRALSARIRSRRSGAVRRRLR